MTTVKVKGKGKMGPRSDTRYEETQEPKLLPQALSTEVPVTKTYDDDHTRTT